MTTIHCRIVLPPSSEQVHGTLRVRILDTARQDAAATVLASTELPHATVSVEEPREVTVELDTHGPEDAPRTLSVEAHLDVDGSGETSVGDYRTMIHIPVDLAGTTSGIPITVPVRHVT